MNIDARIREYQALRDCELEVWAAQEHAKIAALADEGRRAINPPPTPLNPADAFQQAILEGMRNSYPPMGQYGGGNALGAFLDPYHAHRDCYCAGMWLYP